VRFELSVVVSGGEGREVGSEARTVVMREGDESGAGTDECLGEVRQWPARPPHPRPRQRPCDSDSGLSSSSLKRSQRISTFLPTSPYSHQLGSSSKSIQARRPSPESGRHLSGSTLGCPTYLSFPHLPPKSVPCNGTCGSSEPLVSILEVSNPPTTS